MDTARQKIIDRINKLLAMADPERGATEAEQEQAMSRAQALMHEHRISLLEAHQGQGGDSEAQATVATFTRSEKWQGSLRGYILNALGGKAIIDRTHAPTNGSAWIYVGTPSQLDLLELLAAHLINWLPARAKLARKAQRPSNPKAFNRAFYDEAGRVIHHRLREREAAMAAQAPTGMELVKVEGAAVQRFIDQRFGANGLRPTRGPNYSDGGGRHAGNIAGQQANLAAGSVKSGAAKQLGA